MKNDVVLASASYLTPLNAFKGIMIAIVGVYGVYLLIQGIQSIAEGLSEDNPNSTSLKAGLKKLAGAGLCIAIDVVLGLMGV